MLRMAGFGAAVTLAACYQLVPASLAAREGIGQQVGPVFVDSYVDRQVGRLEGQTREAPVSNSRSKKFGGI